MIEDTLNRLKMRLNFERDWVKTIDKHLLKIISCLVCDWKGQKIRIGQNKLGSWNLKNI